MSFHFQPASPSIAPAVRAFWGFDEEISVGAPDERIVPDGCAEIIVQFGDVFHERNTGGYLEQPRVVFAGQITRPLWLRVGMRADVFAVRLQPGGARRLGLPPQWMLADQRLVMADLMAPSMRARFDECLERMAGAPTFDARAAHMHAFIESIISLHPIDAAERCIASISGRRGD